MEQVGIISKYQNYIRFKLKMKNFNNDEIDKYESMSKRALSKYFKTSSFSLPKFRFKTVLKCCSVAALIYLGYRVYRFHRMQQEQYIDFFQVKKQLSTQVRRTDLLQKLQSFSFTDKQFATRIFEEKLRESFPKLLQKVKEKKDYQSQQYDLPKHRQKAKNKKSEKRQRKAHAEIILSKTETSKLDLGYAFKLHSKTTISSISNNYQYLKKTYTVPVLFLNTPFLGRKKQVVKKIKSKEKLSQTVSNKQHFEFSSQCEGINYWNLKYIQIFRRNKGEKKQNKQNLMQKQIEQKKLQSKETEAGFTIPKSQKEGKDENDKSKQRKQLLFECRKRIKAVEQDFVKQIKKVVNEHWEGKGNNTKNYNQSQFRLTTWEQEKQK